MGLGEPIKSGSFSDMARSPGAAPGTTSPSSQVFSSRIHSKGLRSQESITKALTVAARVRPFVSDEIVSDAALRISVGDQNQPLISVTSRSKERDQPSFTFDSVFWGIDDTEADADTSQAEVYASLGCAAVTAVMDGYHSCILAYGQTGSGKTHTMLGTDDAPGLVPRAVADLFAQVDARATMPSMQGHSVRVDMSALEIYNDRIYDLLLHDHARRTPSLRVRLHPAVGVVVPGLRMVRVTNAAEALRALRVAMSHRTTAATQMNDRSSRSHAIFRFTVTVERTATRDDGGAPHNVQVSALNLVDLAGSERVGMLLQPGMAGYEGGGHMREATSINLSLSTLRRVIDALIEIQKNPQQPIVPPYRDSQLTLLLSDSIGGNSVTSFVACVSPSTTHTEESLATLRYAATARHIVNHVRRNIHSADWHMQALQEEVASLHAQLAERAHAVPLADYTDAVARVERAEAVAADAVVDAVEARARIDDLERRLTTATARADVAEGLACDADRDAAAVRQQADADLERAARSAEAYAAERDAALAARDELHARIAAMVDDYAALRSAHEDQSARWAAAQTESAELRTRHAVATADRDTAQERLAALVAGKELVEGARADATRAHAAAMAEIDALASELAVALSQRDALARDRDTLAVERDAAVAARDAAVAERDAATSHAARAAEDLAGADRRVAALRTDADTADARARRAHIAAAAAMSGAAEQLHRWARAVHEDEIALMANVRTLMLAAWRAQRTAETTAATHIAAAAAAEAAARAATDSTVVASDESAARMVALETSLRAARAECAVLRASLQVAGTAAARASDARSDDIDEMARAHREASTLRADLDSERSRASRLEAECEALRSAVVAASDARVTSLASALAADLHTSSRLAAQDARIRQLELEADRMRAAAITVSDSRDAAEAAAAAAEAALGAAGVRAATDRAAWSATEAELRSRVAALGARVAHLDATDVPKPGAGTSAAVAGLEARLCEALAAAAAARTAHATVEADIAAERDALASALRDATTDRAALVDRLQSLTATSDTIDGAWSPAGAALARARVAADEARVRASLDEHLASAARQRRVVTATSPLATPTILRHTHTTVASSPYWAVSPGLSRRVRGASVEAANEPGTGAEENRALRAEPTDGMTTIPKRSPENHYTRYLSQTARSTPDRWVSGTFNAYDEGESVRRAIFSTHPLTDTLEARGSGREDGTVTRRLDPSDVQISA